MTRIEQIRREARDIQNLLECTTVSDIDSMVRRLDQLVYITLEAGHC